MTCFIRSYQSFICFCLFIVITVAFYGCTRQEGPALPIESIDPSLPVPLKQAITELYQKDADDVIVSIKTIASMGEQATPATPYLSSMLTDSCLGTVWVKEYVNTVPVSKVAAVALGSMGAPGITALADALTGTKQVKGMEDDLLRESVAHGLKHALSVWGEDAFKSLSGTKSVDALIQTAELCLDLDESPGRFDKTDPRNSLKYFKHFDALNTREGLETYLKILGMAGDKQALKVLASIFPLATNQHDDPEKIPSDPFETAAVMAQYRISPIPFNQIHPPCVDILMIEFTASGDAERLGTLLSQGANPDILTRTGHPLIELAFKENHQAVFDQLITSGAHVDLRLTRNDTLLIRASREGDHDFVQALLKHGANPALTNNARETALDASLAQLLSFWNGKPYDRDAKPFFKTIEILQAADSPPVNEKIMTDMDKKSRGFLKL